jgi:hypothetical protein
VAAAKVAPTPSNTASKFDYQPQPDLNGCLDQTIKLLEAQDVLSLVKTLMPPDVLQRMIASGRVASMEDVAALYSARPDVNQVMGQLQQVLVSVKSQTPELNSDGTQASYKMDASVSDYKGPGEDNGNIVFVKVQGNWYLK